MASRVTRTLRFLALALLFVALAQAARAEEPIAVDPTLRVDAVRVSVFRQTEGRDGWVDAEVDPTTASGLEDNILARARELRVAALGEQQG